MELIGDVETAELKEFHGVFGLHITLKDRRWYHYSGDCLTKISKAFETDGGKC